MYDTDAVATSARAAGMRPSEANQHADKIVRTVNNGGAAKHADDFIIGDRVIVGGNKHGHVQFLGETQFASGEWAGVVLDDAIGKNDGSVNGIRYFQCEPKKGVFARPDKLVRESAGHVDSKSAVGGIARHVPSTPRMGTRVSSPRSSMSKPPGSKPGLMIDDKQDPAGLKVGDRVLVSGSKLGTLRFTGTTEFAKGEWVLPLQTQAWSLFAPSKGIKGQVRMHPELSSDDGLQQGKLSTNSSSISSMGSSNASSISRGMALSSGDLGSSPRGSVDSKKTQFHVELGRGAVTERFMSVKEIPW
nr:CAP-Gly domain-containing linker protein 1-like [Lytechinus pictus]